MNRVIVIIVEITRENGDKVAGYGRVTPAERAAGPRGQVPVWYAAANRAAAKALRGHAATSWGKTFAFRALTVPQVIDWVDGTRGNYSATAVDSRGAAMGRAVISVG